MLKQCAGCGTVFDDKSGKADQSPRPYGCCDTCNATYFRSNELLGGAAEPTPVPDETHPLDKLLAETAKTQPSGE